MKTIWLLLALTASVHAQQTWQFAVAGDSRNCGDVVMPSIANSVQASGAQFYWHIGDFRKTTDFDEDMLAAAAIKGKHLSITDYANKQWPDFILHRAGRFKVPVYLGIGNHETAFPKTDRKSTRLNSSHGYISYAV